MSDSSRARIDEPPDRGGDQREERPGPNWSRIGPTGRLERIDGAVVGANENDNVDQTEANIRPVQTNVVPLNAGVEVNQEEGVNQQNFNEQNVNEELSSNHSSHVQYQPYYPEFPMPATSSSQYYDPSQRYDPNIGFPMPASQPQIGLQYSYVPNTIPTIPTVPIILFIITLLLILSQFNSSISTKVRFLRCKIRRILLLTAGHGFHQRIPYSIILISLAHD